MTFRLVLFIYLIFLASCNFTEQYIARMEKAYEAMGVQRHYIALDSSKILLRDVGAGNQTIVLVHGFGPLAQEQWKEVVQELHQEFRLIVPDLVYFGESTSDFVNYDPKFQARQLHQAIRKLGIDQYYLAGLSFGGKVSALLAHRFPDEVRGLVLVDAASYLRNPGYRDSLAQANGFASAQDMLVPKNGKELKKIFKISYFDPPGYPAFLLNGTVKYLYKDEQGHKQGMIDYLYSHSENSQDYKYNGPIQILWGEKDILIPLDNAYKLQNFYGTNSQLTIIPEAGHALNMEKPREVAELIREFVKN